MNAICDSKWLSQYLHDRGGVMTITLRLTTHG